MFTTLGTNAMIMHNDSDARIAYELWQQFSRASMHVIGQKPHEKSHFHIKDSNSTLSLADDESQM
jgi:hypothetical protein